MRSSFILFGVLAVDSPRKIEMQRYSDGRMNTNPPRLNWLHFRQQSFRKLTGPFVWNYVLDNSLEEVEEVEDVSSDDDESVVSSPVLPPPPPSTAITPVNTSATPVDNNTSSKYPHLS